MSLRCQGKKDARMLPIWASPVVCSLRCLSAIVLPLQGKPDPLPQRRALTWDDFFLSLKDKCVHEP
jgi:hypothetical protein